MVEVKQEPHLRSHADNRPRSRVDDELFLVGSGARQDGMRHFIASGMVSEAHAHQTHEAGWAIRKHSGMKKWSKVRAKRKTTAGDATRT